VLLFDVAHINVIHFDVIRLDVVRFDVLLFGVAECTMLFRDVTIFGVLIIIIRYSTFMYDISIIL
jgi:hypothetical protein